MGEGGAGEKATASGYRNVLLRSYHNAPSDDRVWAVQRNLSIRDVNLGHTAGVGYYVPEVSSMPVLVLGTAMMLPKGIEVGACTHTTWGRD